MQPKAPPSQRRDADRPQNLPPPGQGDNPLGFDVHIGRRSADPAVRNAIDDELREMETLWDDVQTPTLKERHGASTFLAPGDPKE